MLSTVWSVIFHCWLSAEFGSQTPTDEPSAVACPPTSSSCRDPTFTRLYLPLPVVERIHWAEGDGSAAGSPGTTRRAPSTTVSSRSPVPVATTYRERLLVESPSERSVHSCCGLVVSAVLIARPVVPVAAAGVKFRPLCTPCNWY